MGDSDIVYSIFLYTHTRPTYTCDEASSTELDSTTRQYASPDDAIVHDDGCDTRTGRSGRETYIDSCILIQTEDREIIGKCDGRRSTSSCLDSGSLLQYISYDCSPRRCSLLRDDSYSSSDRSDATDLGEDFGFCPTDNLACGIDTLPDLTRSCTVRILNIVSGRSAIEEDSITSSPVDSEE